MASINSNFLKLKAGYLFPEIARRVKAFSDANPDKAAKIIRCGIGDVTEPLPAAVRAAMHEAIDRCGAGASDAAAEKPGIFMKCDSQAARPSEPERRIARVEDNRRVLLAAVAVANQTRAADGPRPETVLGTAIENLVAIAAERNGGHDAGGSPTDAGGHAPRS